MQSLTLRTLCIMQTITTSAGLSDRHHSQQEPEMFPCKQTNGDLGWVLCLVSLFLCGVFREDWGDLVFKTELKAFIVQWGWMLFDVVLVTYLQDTKSALFCASFSPAIIGKTSLGRKPTVPIMLIVQVEVTWEECMPTELSGVCEHNKLSSSTCFVWCILAVRLD